MNTSRETMPQWWFVKDEDVYVHVQHLANLTDAHNPNDLLLIAHMGCPSVCGGGGLLFSKALAEELAFNHGDRWLNHLKREVENEGAYWVDNQMPVVMDWVKDKGARIVHAGALQPFANLDPICTGRRWKRPNNAICFKIRGCKCAADPFPASWHITGNPRGNLRSIAFNIKMLDQT
eukprot:gnl/TRDRNA2_/TRDRNA2_165021_c0_seq2.p1 gnl/TRDRNA2_/TRDRNA2_165021_c0~~gnl/TRDRNA2_/TRDRNA2_165021_c0_seq2.p1  ORF type:complete len:177 (+),score=21.86 gnl/TRDRNA2_/TRDRNA2_165021_c0_seq2:170-700(+)